MNTLTILIALIVLIIIILIISVAVYFATKNGEDTQPIGNNPIIANNNSKIGSNNIQIANNNPPITNKIDQTPTNKIVQTPSNKIVQTPTNKIVVKNVPIHLDYECGSPEKSAIEKKYEEMYPPYQMTILDVERGKIGDNSKICDVLFQYKENESAPVGYAHRGIKFGLDNDYKWNITDMGNASSSTAYKDFYNCTENETDIFENKVGATTDKYTYTVQNIKNIDSNNTGEKSCEITYLMNPTIKCNDDNCSRGYGLAKANYKYDGATGDWILNDVDYTYRPPRK